MQKDGRIIACHQKNKEQQMRDEDLEQLAEQSANDFTRRTRVMQDFRYDEQQEKYWDTTTGNLLGAKSVDGAIHPNDWPTRIDGRSGEQRPFAPSRAINSVDTGLTVEGATWWPGKPKFIHDVVVSERGAMPLKGAVCYNSYLAPERSGLRKDRSPQQWIDHVIKLYPDPLEHNHFFDYCAHMVQKPHEKVNHGVVLAGGQGLGKDTALLPVRYGVGEWNAAEIGPDAITQQYNGYLKAVLLVINEVRPHDEDHKASNFYNMLKPILAAPPEMLPMTLKYANTIYIRNLCHVVLTTNDPLTMYIPPEDRRLFVMTSVLDDPKTHNVFPEGYFEDLHQYFQDGGKDAVVNWLLERDILQFNSANPPPMTRGKKAIIDSANQVRRTLVDDIFELYSDQIYAGQRPEIIFHRDLVQFVNGSEMFDDAQKVINMLNAKNFHFKMAERGYDMVRNPDGAEWKSGKYRTRMAFIRREVPHGDQLGRIRDELTRRPLEMNLGAVTR
jgi:hypothetical protein